MKRVFILLLVVSIAACKQPRVNIELEKEAIAKCWTDWPKKAMTRDPELGTYYFADDATIMGQELPTVKGKRELIKFFSPMLKDTGVKVNWGEKPDIIEFSEDGTMAYSIDKQELSRTDSTGKVETKINQALHVWKKDNKGDWKVSLVFMYPKN